MFDRTEYGRTTCPEQALLQRPVRHRTLFYWGVSRLIRGGRRALLADVRGSLPYDFAREHGVEVVRVDPFSLRRLCGAWIEPDRSRKEMAVVDQVREGRVYLAGKNRNIRVRRPVYTGAGGCPAEDRVLKMRTLDSEFLGLTPVGWLHLNDGEALGEILSGGSRFLQEHRPLLTLMPGTRLSDLAYIQGLAGMLRQEGYSLWDGTLHPVNSSWKDCGKGITDMLAVPEEQESVVSCLRSIFFAGDPGGSMADLSGRMFLPDMVDQRLMQVCGEKRGLLEEGIFGNSRSCSIVSLKKNNWYEAEYNENDSWCWSGPDRDARLLLPLFGHGKILVDLDVYGVSDAAAGGAVCIFAGGVLQKVDGVVQAGEKLSLDVVVSRAGFQGFLPVLIAVVGTQRSPASSRQLGLALAGVTVSWT